MRRDEKGRGHRHHDRERITLLSDEGARAGLRAERSRDGYDMDEVITPRAESPSRLGPAKGPATDGAEGLELMTWRVWNTVQWATTLFAEKGAIPTLTFFPTTA